MVPLEMAAVRLAHSRVSGVVAAAVASSKNWFCSIAVVGGLDVGGVVLAGT